MGIEKNKIIDLKYIKNAKIENDKTTFDINNVEQLKPSISMHIKINANKDELKQYFADEIE